MTMQENDVQQVSVLIDDLEYRPDGTYFYKGSLFTGVALEKSERGGLISRIEFEAGREHGKAEDFYSSGQLDSRTLYLQGLRHGEELEWYPSGKKKVARNFDQGRLIRERVWSEDGLLVIDNRCERDAL